MRSASYIVSTFGAFSVLWGSLVILIARRFKQSDKAYTREWWQGYARPARLEIGVGIVLLFLGILFFSLSTFVKS